MAVNLTNADKALKTYYLDAVSSQLDSVSPFYAAIKRSTDNVWGKEVKKLVTYGVNGGIGAGTEEGSLPAAFGNEYKEITVTLKNLYGTIEITDKAIRVSENDGGAFVNLLNAEMDGLIRSGAVKIGEEVYFITDGKLGVLKNEVKTYDLPVDLKSVEIKNAATALGYYLLHLKKNGKGVLLCVKKRTDGSLFTFLKDFDGELENEGCFYDQTENAVFAFTETADGENYIADDDLDKCGLKTLTGINFHCRTGGSLKITGDFGEKTFSVKKDCNIIKCRLRSKVFSFYSDVAPAEITAKYLFNGGL